MPGRREIRVAPDQDSWANDAAGLLGELGQQAVQDQGLFLLALSGGRTPERLYQRLTAPPFRDRTDWSNTRFFFSDERCVSPDHPDSNFRLADRTLFRPLNIACDHVYRMEGEQSDADRAARDYEHLLRSASAGEWPRLDVVLLGLGTDGHTASLFPGTEAVHERRRWVTVGQAPTHPARRLTLTLGVINQATVILFLVTGAEKAGIVRSVLEPRLEAERELPASLVKPAHGRVIWLMDRSAAAELTEDRDERHTRHA